MTDGARIVSPGRVCLLGDHCDWAGGHCVAAPLPQRIEALARPRLDRSLVVESRIGATLARGTYSLDDPGFASDDPLRYAAAALLALRERGVLVRGAEVRADSTLTPRRGLGSSAAFTLLILKAMARVMDVSLAPRELADLAYRAERGILGIECGLMDQAASAYGRPVFLDFTDGEMRVEELQLPAPVHLVLGDCGGVKSGPRILEALNRAHRAGAAGGNVDAERTLRSPDEGVAYAFARLFPPVVREGRDALMSGNLRALGEAMIVCQAVYDEYLRPACRDLAGERLPALLEVCRAHGALGQKWTGSGGDGAFVALAKDAAHQERIAAALRAAGAGASAVTL